MDLVLIQRHHVNTLKVCRHSTDDTKVLGFELDSVSNLECGVNEEYIDSVLRLRGWVQLLSSEQVVPLKGYVRQKGELITFDFNEDREDVVVALSSMHGIGNYIRRCGFCVSVFVEAESIEVGVYGPTSKIPLFDLCNTDDASVIVGEQDWLFLGKDSNDSVAQFKGEKRISWLNQWRWNRYFKQINQLAFSCCLLVVPSKEYVYTAFYPIKNKGISPIEQLLLTTRHEGCLWYPLSIMQKSELRTYRKNDTHWSLWGAWIASKAYLQKFCPDVEIPNISGSDFFYEPSQGDLGNKRYPRITTDELQFSGKHYSAYIRYDNKLPNFGRVLYLVNEMALNAKTLLIFGSSSAYSMLYFLCLSFKEVVFIHSSGSVDKTILNLINPEFVLLQTNARFVVKPLSARVSLEKIIYNKLKHLIKGEGYKLNCDLYGHKGLPERVKALHKLLLKCMEKLT